MALSRLKQGFESPREHQSQQQEPKKPAFARAFPFSGVCWLRVLGRCGACLFLRLRGRATLAWTRKIPSMVLDGAILGANGPGQGGPPPPDSFPRRRHEQPRSSAANSTPTRRPASATRNVSRGGRPADPGPLAPWVGRMRPTGWAGAQPRSCRVRRTAHTSKARPSLQG